MNNQEVYRWRGLEGPSLEILRLSHEVDSIRVQSDFVSAGPVPFAVSYDWVLDSLWRTRSLRLRLRSFQPNEMLIARSGETSWRVDGEDRIDLLGCQEIDLSITPFCNTLALLRFGQPPGGGGELSTLYVNLPELSLTPSRQRYEPIGSNEFLYVDLGTYAGFRARLSVDADGIVRKYEGLFERIDGAG